MRVILALAGALLLSSPLASARDSWSLDLSVKRFDTMRTRGIGGTGHYLYMVYEVSNNSNVEASLGLSLQVETDAKAKDGKPKVYWNRTDTKVLEALMNRGIIDGETKNAGDCRSTTIAPGDTVTCIAVFGKLDNAADFLKLSVGGLKDPVQIRNGKRYVEDIRRIINYHRPGDEFTRDQSHIKLINKTWVTLKSALKPYK